MVGFGQISNPSVILHVILVPARMKKIPSKTATAFSPFQPYRSYLLPSLWCSSFFISMSWVDRYVLSLGVPCTVCFSPLSGICFVGPLLELSAALLAFCTRRISSSFIYRPSRSDDELLCPDPVLDLDLDLSLVIETASSALSSPCLSALVSVGGFSWLWCCLLPVLLSTCLIGPSYSCSLEPLSTFFLQSGNSSLTTFFVYN